jgi:hypothetical protein
VAQIVAEIEETDSYADDLRVKTATARDSIHRCRYDGSVAPDDGGYPLSYAVLGVRHMHDAYDVCHATAVEARDTR